MSNQDDDDIKLRDKLAMVALPALIQRFNDKVDTKWIENGEITEGFERNSKLIALLAYKIADEMRKVRLIAFT